MEYSVPQFIEKPAKIIGPFTMKQFLYIGVAGGIAIILYFSVDFAYFIMFSILLGGAAFALAFLSINGIPLTTVIKNFLFFSVAPRIYIWKKKEIPLFKKAVETKVIQKTEETTATVLPIETNGRLKKLRNDIELRV